MGYKGIEKENNKYYSHFIDMCVKTQFGLSLAPAQLQVLESMLLYDYVLFMHGRTVGATFMLALLSTILRLGDPKINLAVASASIRQANFVVSEVEKKFGKYNLEPLNIVPIKEALSGKYDVLLLDEMTHLSNEYVDTLITHIENKTISKIIAVSVGFRQYFPIMKLFKCLCIKDNRTIISKDYEDMPERFFALDLIEEAKKVFDYPEEFEMEYKCRIL